MTQFDRRTGIGASEAALALGLAPASWGTPYDLYLRKRGEAPEPEQNRFMEAGNRLEPAIADWYADLTGHKLARCVTTRHPQHEWLFATPDRLATDAHKLVQIKNIQVDAYRNSLDWGPVDETTRIAAGDSPVPEEYAIQTQVEMAVFGVDRNDLAVLVGGNDLVIYPRAADPERQAIIIDELAGFWHCVQTGTPPQPRTMTEAKQRYPQTQRVNVTATEEALEWLRTLRSLQGDAKANESEIDALKARLCALMGDGDILTHPQTGQALATWKSQDRKEYTVPASSTRVFRIK